MEDETTREEKNSTEPTEDEFEEPVDSEGAGPIEIAPGDVLTEAEHDAETGDEPDAPPGEGEGKSKALKKSIGLGLPSDRYRVVLPKGSFAPLTGRQQFIARLRDRDRVSFRVFEGDEDLASQNEFLVELGLVGIALNNEDKAFLELELHLNLELILRVRLMDKFGEKETYVVLDMARRPKTIIHQDNVNKLAEKIESLENQIVELGRKIPSPKGKGAK